jgi:hypothetical protein
MIVTTQMSRCTHQLKNEICGLQLAGELIYLYFTPSFHLTVVISVL